MTRTADIFSREFFDGLAPSVESPWAPTPLLSRERRRMGRVLLHQQCWLFGCDIRRKEGNLLLAVGFDRHRPPAGLEASTQYRLELPSGCRICLWGFGIFYGDPTLSAGVFLNRFDFDPRLSPRHDYGPDTWKPEALCGLRRVRTQSDRALAKSLVPAALEWIAEYESWILETVGIGYRRACLDRWPHESVAPHETVYAWRKLARAVRRRVGKDTGENGSAIGRALQTQRR
ncbi:MAG TPA: hypothetical protein VM008_05800 [Phycisphaerae bacterium]|nr:hypothetical protein [Phycisphaerae bacterium]